MPEGDVLLRTARRLSAALGDQVLVRAELRWPTLADADLTGQRCLETASYGKHLLTRFEGGSTLHTHLRMDGVWRVARTSQPVADSSQLRAILATATWTCRGYLIGMMDLVRTRDEHVVLAGLGPDLLAPDVEDHLDQAAAAVLAQGGREIGAVLLDQHIAAGIGTIWMAETLFRHRVHPLRAASDTDGLALLTTASRLMRASADAPGGVAGYRSIPHAVHGRAGQPCPRCQTRVAVVRVGQAPYDRPAFFCPRCQPS